MANIRASTMTAFMTAGSSRPSTPVQSPPVMSGALFPSASAAPLTLGQALTAPVTPNDPAGFSYIINRHSAAIARQPSVRDQSRSKRDRFRSRAKRVVDSISRTFKRTFNIGTEKNASKPYGEYATLNRSSSRSSMRSRRSATRMTRPNYPQPAAPAQTNTDSNRSSTPSIFVTSPSVNGNGKRRTYAVHEHAGIVSEPSPVRKSVLIGFPVVSAAYGAPPTPLTAATASSSDRNSAASPGWVAAVSKYAHLDANGSPVASPTSVDFAGQVNPKLIIRKSGIEIEADPSAFAQLMNTVDGMPTRADLQKLLSQAQKSDRETLPSQRPQPKRASTELPYLAKTVGFSLDDEYDAIAGAENDTVRDQHRSVALAALESSTPAFSAAPAQQATLPDSLRPGQLPIRRRPVNRSRPYTTGGLYVPFTAKFDPFNEGGNETIQSPTTTGASRTANRNSDDSGIPSFADNKTHSQHYSRIESGIFDSPVSMPPRPANPEPSARFSGSSYFSTESPTSGGASIPPPSPPTSSSSNDNHQIRRKPVGGPTVPNFSRMQTANTNKSLPPPPSARDPRRFTNGVVPPAFTMNTNGYPMMTQQSVTASAQPVVRRKPVDSVQLQAKRYDAAKTQSKQTKSDQKDRAHAFRNAIGKLMG